MNPLPPLTAHSALSPRILEADDQDMLEEERRLFYVALTRAVSAQRRGTSRAAAEEAYIPVYAIDTI
jgi:superfamily I DNA/RNA helicase